MKKLLLVTILTFAFSLPAMAWDDWDNKQNEVREQQQNQQMQWNQQRIIDRQNQERSKQIQENVRQQRDNTYGSDRRGPGY